MFFRFYSNEFSRATKGLAGGVFVIGMLLTGFGILIIALPELFAALAAAVFFIAGLGCAGWAVRLFIMGRRMKEPPDPNHDAYRHNVRIHEEYHDI